MAVATLALLQGAPTGAATRRKQRQFKASYESSEFRVSNSISKSASKSPRLASEGA